MGDGRLRVEYRLRNNVDCLSEICGWETVWELAVSYLAQRHDFVDYYHRQSDDICVGVIVSGPAEMDRIPDA